MSIFERIENAIFGHSPPPSAGTPASSLIATHKAAPSAASPPSQSASGPRPTVDVETVLDGLNSKSLQKLNWRSSIVDLMKLIGLDSSLQSRTQLAKELNYSGNPSDSAAMNKWLHTQVMRKLAENGGKVPASLTGK